MENKKNVKIEKWAMAVMLILGVLFYFVPGKWISLESDSVAYIEQRGRQGVLPGYPVFLSFFRSIMGEEFFLNGVVIAQSILAIVCTFIFVMILQKQFLLKGWECILLYLATMLPFSIYLPESGITHQIMTEGITYAIFYLYFIMILKAVWTLKIRWYGGSLLLAFVLGMIRSQMLFLQALCFLLLIWLIWKRGKGRCWYKRIGMLCVIAIAGMVIAYASYKLIYAIVIYDNQRIVEDMESKKEKKKETQEVEKTDDSSDTIYVGVIEHGQLPSQFDSLIISRGFYEAEREDAALFEDEMIQDIFLKTYELADESGHLYQYAKPGLYMWEDLVYDGMTGLVGQAVDAYDEEHPGLRTRDRASITRELGFRVLFKHFDRYLYHVFRLMVPSLIATVFFQIRPIYFLCHVIALLLYLFAIGSALWVRRYGGNRDTVYFTFAIVCSMIVLAAIVNIVFIGLQRYVVYGMGIFYCAMYLQLKEIYFIAKTKVSKRRNRICIKGKDF